MLNYFLGLHVHWLIPLEEDHQPNILVVYLQGHCADSCQVSLWGRRWNLVPGNEVEWSIESTLVVNGYSSSTSPWLSRRCFTRQRNSFPRRWRVTWMTWTPRTHSGAGSTWRNVGSGTCFRYPTPNFTGKGLPLCRLLLMELWKVPALMESSVARSLFLPPDNNLLEAVVA